MFATTLPYVDKQPSNRSLSEARYLIAMEAGEMTCTTHSQHWTSPPDLPPMPSTSCDEINTEVKLAQVALLDALEQSGALNAMLDAESAMQGELRAARIKNYWLERELRVINAKRKVAQLEASARLGRIAKEDAELRIVCTEMERQLAAKNKERAFMSRHFGSR